MAYAERSGGIHSGAPQCPGGAGLDPLRPRSAPLFSVFSALLFFQGGRLIAYCLGQLDNPFRIELINVLSIWLDAESSRSCAAAAGAVRRLRLRTLPMEIIARSRPQTIPGRVGTCLTSIWLFYGSLPIQLFKNYRYYQYAQEHGGYPLFWVEPRCLHGQCADSGESDLLWSAFQPLLRYLCWRSEKISLRRHDSLLCDGLPDSPDGVAWCVFRTSRGAMVCGQSEVHRKTRLLPVALLALSMVLVADVIQTVRGSEKGFSAYSFLPLDFLASQGISLDVTEIEVAYQKLFQPYLPSYLYHELLDAFVSPDYLTYSRGSRLSFDVSVLLNSNAFASGHGTSGSYVGEAYVIGGVAGVVMISLLIGGVLHLMYRLSHNAFSLFLVAMVLPDFLSMPRGQLLDWVSALLRNAISLVVLAMGWSLYRLMTSINRTQEHRIGAPKFSPGEA